MRTVSVPEGVDKILARVSRERSVFLRYRGSHFWRVLGVGRGFGAGWACVDGMGRRGGGVLGDFSMLELGSTVGGIMGSDILMDVKMLYYVRLRKRFLVGG